MTQITVDPVGKPRMTRRDKWMERPCVMRYRAFCDAVRSQTKMTPPDALDVTFHVPMPKSWSKRKRGTMDGEPHRQKPDLDNMLKALLDALAKNSDGKVDDANVWAVNARKVWAERGSIVIE